MKEPAVIGYVCRWSGSDVDGKTRSDLPNGLRVLQLNCLANLTAQLLSDTFLKGADIVFLLGCGGPSCKFYDGWNKVDRTAKGLELLLQDLGLEPERLFVATSADDDGESLAKTMVEASRRARELGPSPYKGGTK